MSDEEINIAIAEACPDKFRYEHGLWFFQYATNCWSQCHNNSICADLNAMHEAEKILTDEQHRMFRNQLFVMTYCREGCTESMAERERVSAPPRNRAEAFLRTIGKWKEEK